MDIVKFVKKIKDSFFLSWILVGVLLAVTISTSFYLCDDGAASGYSLSFSKSNNLIAQDSLQTDFQNHKNASDPCVMGFSHLGHCSNVLAPSILFINLRLDFIGDYSSSYPSLLGRYLDGPFQPPKIA